MGRTPRARARGGGPVDESVVIRTPVGRQLVYPPPPDHHMTQSVTNQRVGAGQSHDRNRADVLETEKERDENRRVRLLHHHGPVAAGRVPPQPEPRAPHGATSA